MQQQVAIETMQKHHEAQARAIFESGMMRDAVQHGTKQWFFMLASHPLPYVMILVFFEQRPTMCLMLYLCVSWALIRFAVVTIQKQFVEKYDHDMKAPSSWPAYQSEHSGGIWVACGSSGKVVGLIALSGGKTRGKTCYMGRLSVLPEWRGQKIATKLISHAMTEAISCFKYQKMQLTCSDWQVDARALYQRLGFSFLYTSPAYRSEQKAWKRALFEFFGFGYHHYGRSLVVQQQ
jgi:ribosomal protein S18 acetylase RimI-like enzyme